MILKSLSALSGKTELELLSFSRYAGNKYKIYTIPKNNGSSRVIEHPARVLKMMQRWIVKNVFGGFPISESAKGYIKGLSILDNATPHLGSRYSLRVDFSDFFWSFDVNGITNFLRSNAQNLKLNSLDIEFICNIITRNGRLVMGAPSSPTVTNVIMYKFDQQVIEYCLWNNIIYTRYADDIFLSCSKVDVLEDAYKFIRNYANMYPYAKLKINEQKTKFLSKKGHRSVTGIVLTPQGRISIGRDRKRIASAKIHRFLNGELEGDDVLRLKGLISWINSIEPNFISSMRRKYGDECIDSLMK